MNDIDQKIQAALLRSKTDEPKVEQLNLAEEVITTFRGRHRWFSILLVGVNLIFVAATIWAVLRFLDAVTVTEQLRWGALAFAFHQAMMFIKLWFWLEMHTNRVLREQKRIELLLLTRLPPH